MFLVCAVTALLALPAEAAAAKPGFVVKPKSLQLRVTLHASNGYSASILTSGHRQVVLVFSQGAYTVSYTTLGRVTRRRISADFGRRGRVSLRFRGKPHRRSSHLPSPLRSCKGRKPVEERGVFSGNVRFRGERGFTGIKARRVKGVVVRSYKRICKGPARAGTSASSTSEFKGELLTASAQAKGIRRSFVAMESAIDVGGGPPLSLAVDVAAREEKAEGVAISKSVFALDETVFHVDPPGKTRVVPSSPFVGSATYLLERHLPTWTGPLGARFPGSGQVSLTGPEFEAELCRAASFSRFDRCLSRLQSLRLFYGSGSHSQPLALARLSSLR